MSVGDSGGGYVLVVAGARAGPCRVRGGAVAAATPVDVQAQALPGAFTARVDRVVDGDTFIAVPRGRRACGSG